MDILLSNFTLRLTSLQAANFYRFLNANSSKSPLFGLKLDSAGSLEIRSFALFVPLFFTRH